MKHGILPLAAAAAAMLPGAAGATIIKPTGATASTVFSASYLPTFTIDGSGLPNPTDITAAHASYTTGNHWTTARGTDPLAQWIDWTFAAPQTIGAAYIWNHRSNNIASNPGYDVTSFDLTFFDLADNVLLVLNDRALAPDTALAQRIDFALVTGVSRIRFDIEGVQSSPSFTGLAEVAFDTRSFVTDPIPEPATWALMISGFAIAGAAARRRRGAALALA